MITFTCTLFFFFGKLLYTHKQLPSSSEQAYSSYIHVRLTPLPCSFVSAKVIWQESTLQLPPGSSMHALIIIGRSKMSYCLLTCTCSPPPSWKFMSPPSPPGGMFYNQALSTSLVPRLSLFSTVSDNKLCGRPGNEANCLLYQTCTIS